MEVIRHGKYKSCRAFSKMKWVTPTENK
jgi:hypothetical protein